MLYRMLLCSLIVILSACGGNDGKGSSEEPCNNSGGVVFEECLNTYYGQFVGADFIPEYVEYTTSNNTQQVQWSVVESNDSTHNKVLDISFKDNDKVALLYIGTPGNPKTYNMSDYKTGTLSFDIKLLEWGDTYNEEKSGAEITFRVDCIWPCGAHETSVLMQEKDTWKNVRIPIADLIATGLDITKTNLALQLNTVLRTQRGLHFQLDNIKYIKGGSAGNSPAVTFKEDFNARVISNWAITNEIGSAEMHTWGDIGGWFTISWSSINDVILWETTLNNTINIRNKKASFQLQCLKGFNNQFSIALSATDTSGTRIVSDAFYVDEYEADEWHQFNLEIGDQFGGGFESNRVEKVGFVISTYSGATNLPTYCRVDTVRITE